MVVRKLFEQVGTGAAASSRARVATTHVGQYQLLQIIDASSTGTSYLARIGDDGAMPVTVKCFVESSMGRTAWVRARAAAARLVHPNIAAWLDDGEAVIAGARMRYLVFADLSGPSLADLARRNDNDPSVRTQALEELLAIAWAVDWCHEQGIAHGDLRLEHMRLCPRGRAHLANFEASTLVETQSLRGRPWSAELERATVTGRSASSAYWLDALNLVDCVLRLAPDHDLARKVVREEVRGAELAHDVLAGTLAAIGRLLRA